MTAVKNPRLRTSANEEGQRASKHRRRGEGTFGRITSKDWGMAARTVHLLRKIGLEPEGWCK